MPFQRVGAITLITGEGENFASGGAIDAVRGFGYWGVHPVVTPDAGSIVKIDLVNFQRVGRLDLNYTGLAGTGSRLHSGVVDTENRFAYFATYNANTTSVPSRIFKIDLASFTQVGFLDLNTDENKIRSLVIDVANQFLYVGSEHGSPKNFIIKINLSTFTRVGNLPGLTASDVDFRTMDLDSTNGFLYALTYSDPSRLLKINTSTFTITSTSVLTQISLPHTGFFSPHGFYFTGRTAGNVIGRVNVNTLAEATITASSPAATFQSSTFDMLRNKGYFATGQTPAQVVEVDLSSFTEVANISAATGENQFNSHTGAIDLVDGFTYFGSFTGPSYIVKFGLDIPSFLSGNMKRKAPIFDIDASMRRLANPEGGY